MTYNKAVNKRVAILIENGVEDVEFQIPYKAMQMAGIEVVVLGPQADQEYKGKQGKLSQKSDGTATAAIPTEFDAVVIPGGMAPDQMRKNPGMVHFVQEMIAQGKLVAAVCHGPQVLISGGLLKGKRATGFYSIKQDIINAGANYIDEPLVVDGNLLTSRQPGDLAIFTTAILSRLGYGGKDAALPNEQDASAEWWKIADAWGGSTKGEIVQSLNTALAGERYSKETFEKYVEKTSDPELRSILQAMVQNKQQTMSVLEGRLNDLGEKPSLKTQAADAYAKLKTALQGSDDMFMLRSALDITQVGLVDSSKLRSQYTDPVSTAIYMQMEKDLAQFEQLLGQLYKARQSASASVSSRPATAIG